METKYGDFILWYFNDCWQRAKAAFVPSDTNGFKQLYSDNLISISVNPPVQQTKLLDFVIKNHHDLKEFVKIDVDPFKPRAVKCKIKSEFLSSLVTDLFSKNWVDIENHYYNTLTKIVKNPNVAPRTKELSYPNLDKINDVFLTIKELFEVYLSTLNQPSTINNLGSILYEDPVDSEAKKLKLT
jgi:hypothetical protein